MREAFLALHIVSGAAALALGAVTLLAFNRRHSTREPLLIAYLGAVFATCVTATVLALLDWSQLWWIVLLALCRPSWRWWATWPCVEVGRNGWSPMAWAAPTSPS